MLPETDGTMLTECVLALWRRRLLVGLAALVAVGLGVAAYLVIPPAQQSDAQVLFVPSVKQPGVDGPTNPLLALGGSVAIVASVVQAQVSDDETALRLRDRGYTADYEVLPNLAENAGPALLVTTDDHSARMSRATLQAVIAEIDDNLGQIQTQEKIRRDLWVRSVVLTSSTTPTVVRTKPVKAGLVGTAGTGLVLLGLILVLERRRIRRGLRLRTDPARQVPQERRVGHDLKRAYLRRPGTGSARRPSPPDEVQREPQGGLERVPSDGPVPR